MKITFLGASKTVTGSNFLVEGAGKKFLVDCGMYQGSIADELENSDPFNFNVDEIDFMLLTHAHIDHSGRIPKLYKEGYRNKVYATKATCELCELMLPDSGHIQEMEAEWKNKKRERKGLEPIPPMYTAEEAVESLEIFSPVSYDNLVDISENIVVRYNDAGHMLGSSIIEVWITENGKQEKIVFSGDIGNNDIPLLKSPTMIDNADYLVMESTYGSRLHLKNENKAELFLDVVYKTLEKGGTVVIPSFAVGRTQEIIFELNKIKDENHSEEFYKKYQKLMSVPVYVDSPLAISATQVFKRNMELFNSYARERIEKGDHPLDFAGLEFTKTPDESRLLNAKRESSIIISASGMCEVGRIKHHLKHHLWDKNSTILFVGYQAPGTLGRKIIDGHKEVKLFGETVSVNANIEYIEGYSGHADQEWLMNFVGSFKQKPKHIFLVHGEENSQVVLKEKIENEVEGINVLIPELGDECTLGETIDIKKQEMDNEHKQRFLKLDIVDRIATLKEEIEDMETIVREDYLMNDVSDDDMIKLKGKLKDLENLIVKIVDSK